MTLYQATRRLEEALAPLYDEREARNIAGLVMEHLTGWNRIDRLMNRQHGLYGQKMRELERCESELLQHRPVQYVLNEAWFYGMNLQVDERVLIPRPETEELAEWIVDDISTDGKEQGLKILDVGTGSGAIALALKKGLPASEVAACDKSSDALEVAAANAARQGLSVRFLQCDFLVPAQWELLTPVDVLVSNPPYIPLTDQPAMQQHVLDYEPHLALFVPADDPLLFYRAIAAFAHQRLPAQGAAYMEIHEAMAADLISLFGSAGFAEVKCRQDLQGKDRMIRIRKG